ncbi:MAG: hypothetical protein J6S85_03770 [Methanobrevibacter sp.]|nr:hypothetical protein [Methanobrevibacter sp.]
MTYFEKQAKIQKKAMRFLKKHTKQEAYDFATWVLHDLEERGFCIWQTYDKDDIEVCLGRKPTKDELADMQERLMNCFEYIRP